MNLRNLLLVTPLALVGGCALPPSQSPPAAPAFRSAGAERTPPPECGKYGACSVDACFGSICFAFSTEGSVQTRLTSGIVDAQGVAADRAGNAYIADAASAAIFEYGPYLTPRIKTYQDYGQVPIDVAVKTKLQLLVASNQSTTSSGAGSVSVFAGGSLTPTATLTDPKVANAQGIGVAIDGSGNCFWSLYDRATGRSKIDEFRSCAGSPLTIVSGKPALRGMAFDARNDLLYIVDVNSTHHDIFKCRGTSHCRPLATNFFKPVMINFDQGRRFLWLDDAGVLEGPLIESLDPRNGHVISSFRAGSSTDPPFGIAHVPGPP